MIFDHFLGICPYTSPVVVTLLSDLGMVSETCTDSSQEIQEFIGGYCNTLYPASPAIP